MGVAKHFSLLLLAVVGLLTLAGCGSKNSAMERMKRNAIRRPKDDDEEAPAKPPKVAQKADDGPKKPAGETTGDTASTPGPVLPDIKPTDRTAPKGPLTEIQKRAWTIKNLQDVWRGMDAYRQERGLFPPPAILDSSNTPILSWRVALLPYLGYGELYKKFHLRETWDSPHNLSLLAEIPPVYQSAERFDDKTNILVPQSSTALFGVDGRAVALRKVEDGLENTIMLIEVDDALAVPWTKPQEYNVKAELRGLGGKREDGIFVVFGSGLLRRVPVTADPADLLAAFTIDGGEQVTPASMSFPVAADPTRSAEDGDQAYESLVAFGQRGGKDDPGGDTAEGAGPSDPAAPAETQAPDTRELPPEEASLAESRQLFREIYGPRNAAAKTAIAKRELCEELLTKGHELTDDKNGRYVLLQAALAVAGAAGEFDLGRQAIEELIRNYRLDEYHLNVKLLKDVGVKPNSKPTSDRTDLAIETAEQALMRDDFSTASELQRLAGALDRQAAAGRNRSVHRDALVSLNRRISAAKSEFSKVKAALRDAASDSPESKTIVGKYYCFVKEEWARGLAMLAEGDDEELRQIAILELARPTNPQLQIELGEAWMAIGTEEMRYREAIWRHAALWLILAENSGLPAGLLRVKAEVQIQEIERAIGHEELDAVRRAVAPATVGRNARAAAKPAGRSRASRRRTSDDD